MGKAYWIISHQIPMGPRTHGSHSSLYAVHDVNIEKSTDPCERLASVVSVRNVLILAESCGL